ncbi:glycosyltransferase family 8 protein [Campylobacter lari]|nr:glycosyltransferase family 8 protein [Campylobacter lari]
MLHIILCADDNYVKFSSVLITSIVNNTNKSKFNNDYSHEKTINAEEGYFFHILTNFISEKNRKKLVLLKQELSKIYPIKIEIHIINEEEFNGLPRWRNNYSAYYRIKLANFIPEHVKTCLYLDSDMLALQDIREVMSINIDNYTIAAVLDGNNRKKRFFKKIDNDTITPFHKNSSYFNSGFMYINLELWRKNKIEQKCFDFLKTYIPTYPDQDALNYAIDDIKQLPICWNFMISYIIGEKIGRKNIFKHRFKKTALEYTKEDFYYNQKNAKIIHYSLDEKPWNKEANFYYNKSFEPIAYPYFDLFWDTAKKTPCFNIDLLKLKEKITLISSQDLSKILSMLLKQRRFIDRATYRKMRKNIIFLYFFIFFVFSTYLIFQGLKHG